MKESSKNRRCKPVKVEFTDGGCRRFFNGLSGGISVFSLLATNFSPGEKKPLHWNAPFANDEINALNSFGVFS